MSSESEINPNEIKEEIKGQVEKIASKVTTKTSSHPCSDLRAALQTNPCFQKVSNVLHWRDIVSSALHFAIGNVLFFLVTYGEYTYTTLASYALLLIALVSLVYSRLQVARGQPADLLDRLRNQTNEDRENARAHIESGEKVMSASLDFLVDLLKWNNFPATLSIFLGLLLVSQIAKLLSGTVLVYITFLLAFSLPRAYEFKKAQVDETVKKVVDIVEQKWKLVEEKVPFLSAKPKTE